MRTVVLYAGVSGAVILVLGLLLAIPYDAPEERRALLLSGVVAFVVQLGAFWVLRTLRDAAAMMGWVFGILTRFLVIAIYALVVLKRVGLPEKPALVSLALFLVICTVIEPLLLER